MTQVLEQAYAKLRQAPEEDQDRIAVMILAELEKWETVTQTPKRRIGGLHRGMTKMSDDFAAPLPDDFWTVNE